MSARRIWHLVADATDPGPLPYIVIRIDTSVRCHAGVEGTVVSVHASRVEAEAIAAALDRQRADA